MDDEVNILVIWPSGRKVTMHVEIQPYVQVDEGLARPPAPEDTEAGITWPIGHRELKSAPAFRKFLERATRAAKEGDAVEAVCMEDDHSLLLEMTEAPDPPPDPILVKVGVDGRSD
jgi:hypothetical protein